MSIWKQGEKELEALCHGKITPIVFLAPISHSESFSSVFLQLAFPMYGKKYARPPDVVNNCSHRMGYIHKKYTPREIAETKATGSSAK